MLQILEVILVLGLTVVHASPAFPGPSRVPGIVPVRIAAEHPLITPSPSLDNPTRTLKSRRGVVSEIKDHFTGIEGYIGSQLSGAPGYVASGVADFFEGFPTGDKVKSSLGLNDDQIAALPTQVLNVP